MNIINNVALCRVNKHWFIISSINKTNIKVFLVENVMRNSLFFSQMKTFNSNCISQEKSVSNGFFFIYKNKSWKIPDAIDFFSVLFSSMSFEYYYHALLKN